MSEVKKHDLNGVVVTVRYTEADMTLMCSVQGNLETSNSSGFLETLEKELEGKPVKKMILELAELYYVSSTGIGSFTTLLISCRNKGAELILRNMNHKVKSVFDLLGFSSFFVFEEGA